MKLVVRTCVYLTLLGAALNILMPTLSLIFPNIVAAFSWPERVYNGFTHLVSLTAVLYLVHIVNGQMQERRRLIELVHSSLTKRDSCDVK